MSQINTNAILDASGGTTTSINGYTPTVSNMAGRNRIINGDMRIDQRNAGASVSANAAYGVDRWLMNFAGGGVYSAQRSTTTPAGFSNSTILTVTTADSSIASTDYYRFRQAIEGFNISDLGWGTASAQPVTISFWVRSSVTGTYCVGLQNSSVNRSYGAEYTISAANTWEYKTITVAGDTTGTWSTDNGTGVTVYFDLGSGSSFNQAVNTWAGTNTWKTSAQTNWISTSGATFYITGVQLEAGSVATPFEHRQYGQELALCQRYFQTTDAMSLTGTMASATLGTLQLRSQMRATPTVALTAPFKISDTYVSDHTQSSASVTISLGRATNSGVNLSFTNFSGLTAGRPYLSLPNETGFITLSAEL